MERRSLLWFFGISAVSATTGERLLTPFFRDLPTVREVTIYFPQGSGFNSFQSDLSKWLDVPAWKSFLDRAQANHSIVAIQRQIFPDKVVYKYEFRNGRDLLLFRFNAQSALKVDLSKFAALGYSESIKIS